MVTLKLIDGTRQTSFIPLRQVLRLNSSPLIMVISYEELVVTVYLLTRQTT
uniref:Uncharacterized protein n=1 Tax=uncultured marine virus TaxID=186617 RepID=A0A0F7L757_9VIRU|nr:hypothetical protein Nham_4267 [uncultured marine virus]